jgi:hypothetical protein
VINRTARIASSLDGMGQSISCGLELVSTIATIGSLSRFASATAIASRCGSTMKTMSGTR